MATAAVHTPKKSHGGLFSTRAAGGRMPLTPSPRARKSGNSSPFCTPPPKGERLAVPAPPAPKNSSSMATSTSFYPANLASCFAALQLSAKKGKAAKSPVSKSQTNISKPIVSPIKLDLGVNDWTLTGTNSTAGGQTPEKQGKQKKEKAAARPARKAKTTVRINGDRFIPVRGASSPTTSSKLDFSQQSSSRPGTSDGRSSSASSRIESVLDGGIFGNDEHLRRGNNAEEDDEISYPPPNPGHLAYQSSVAAACGVSLNQRILAFKPSAPESSKPIDLRSQYNRPLKPSSHAQFRRRILTAPERVLDAPGLLDDYYLNLLDWSNSNQVAIGLERNVYVWNADTGSVSCLLETSPDTYVSNVKWSQDGAYVAVGLGTGDVQIWDVEECVKLRSMSGHSTRVGVSSWNKHILSTGSRSGAIFNHDVRIAEHKVAELTSHTSEVCGLEWRSDGAQLASGGNDNLVNIWDARALQAPKYSKTNHRAAVKALAWCPWQLNLLATGGGSYDKHIHFWNSTTGARVNSIDTGSQVTALRWSTHYREIVSCHGYPDNQLSVWSYPTLVRNIEIPAHETRVLHAALSPDGQTLATAASDESLKFWKLFEKKPAKTASAGRSETGKPSMAKQMTIR